MRLINEDFADYELPDSNDPSLIVKAMAIATQYRMKRLEMIAKLGKEYQDHVSPYVKALLIATAIPWCNKSPLLGCIVMMDTCPDWADRDLVLASLSELEERIKGRSKLN